MFSGLRPKVDWRIDEYMPWCPFVSEVRVSVCEGVSRTAETGHQASLQPEPERGNPEE
jgi:hypothetical protein